MMNQRTKLEKIDQKRKPVLLKIAPDLEIQALKEIVSTAVSLRIDGIIATNTTLSRKGLTASARNENGGLSGKPLREKSTEMIRHIYSVTQGSIPIIGSGGIFSGQHVIEKLKAGQSGSNLYRYDLSGTRDRQENQPGIDKTDGKRTNQPFYRMDRPTLAGNKKTGSLVKARLFPSKHFRWL